MHERALDGRRGSRNFEHIDLGSFLICLHISSSSSFGGTLPFPDEPNLHQEILVKEMLNTKDHAALMHLSDYWLTTVLHREAQLTFVTV